MSARRGDKDEVVTEFGEVAGNCHADALAGAGDECAGVYGGGR